MCVSVYTKYVVWSHTACWFLSVLDMCIMASWQRQKIMITLTYIRLYCFFVGYQNETLAKAFEKEIRRLLRINIEKKLSQMIQGLIHWSNTGKLKKLKLHSLDRCGLLGDLIGVIKRVARCGFSVREGAALDFILPCPGAFSKYLFCVSVC